MQSTVIDELMAENSDLRLENQNLQLIIADLEEENEKLRNQLDAYRYGE